LRPLFAQGRGANHQQAATALGPELAQHQGGFDGLAQAHLIGEHHALAERIVEGEERGIDLMWVQVDTGIEQ
jgi:hypothetical protein